MYKRFAPILVVSLLSGCTLIDGDKYNQSATQAIQQSETNLTSQIAALDEKLDQQASQVEALKGTVSKLNNQLVHQQKTTNKKNLETTKVAVMPAPVIKPSEKPASKAVILGAIESVTLDAAEQAYQARVDTGAATSSLNAIDIENFERNSKQWVRFHISAPNQKNADKKWIEAPVIRFVKIRQATTQKTERRPVVGLWVKLGDIHEKTPFTLTDRSQMTHPILLGREFIKDIALVDVSKNYIQSNNKK